MLQGRRTYQIALSVIICFLLVFTTLLGSLHGVWAKAVVMSEDSGKDSTKSNSKSKRNRNNNSNRGNRNTKKRYGTTSKNVLMDKNIKQIGEMNSKANNRFTVKEKPLAFPNNMEEPKRFSFDWKVSPVALKEEAIMAEEVIRKGEFGWLDDERVEEIAQIVKQHDMSLDQALSLRSALLQQKTVYGHGRLQSRSKALARLYKEGVSIVDLSKRFDFPPMNIFRIVLGELRWSKSKIKECLRSPSKLPERERKEFEEAEAADRVSNVDQSEVQVKADKFEDILSDWFEDQGVKLRRQPEMVREQSAQHGRPVATPDILFLDHVEINGNPVAWIDAKHFYGADVKFQRKKMAAQMSRYINEWGSGAVVYRHGFSANLFMPGCTLLDASPLDLSGLSPEGS